MEGLGVLWPPTISHDVIDASCVVKEGNATLCCQPLHLFWVRSTGSKSFTMHSLCLQVHEIGVLPSNNLPLSDAGGLENFPGF